MSHASLIPSTIKKAPKKQQSATKLLHKLDPYCVSALDAAAQFCQRRVHTEISIEHWLLKLLEQRDGDLNLIARHYDWNLDKLWDSLLKYITELPCKIDAKPILSNQVYDLLSSAWVEASIGCDSGLIRSVHLLAALIQNPELLHAKNVWSEICITHSQLSEFIPLLDTLSVECNKPCTQQFSQFNSNMEFSLIEPSVLQNPLAETSSLSDEIKLPDSVIASPSDSFQASQLAVLNKFTEDITAKARTGKIDPIFGRDIEIRQMINILLRRRKNNPILVGDPGVGKTALVEGLALRIVKGDVPEILKPFVIRSLDLGLLQAGTGVKGEFEQRLKNVVDALRFFEQSSDNPILLFIDEAHMLIGAGNQVGGVDAANLLKPLLARGELRTIAATTWQEYKQYFEKDAALARRFQPVKVNEPDDDRAVLMLRGLKSRYALHHGVHITDEAIKAAVKLSRKYLAERQLPDKALDLLDTASVRVRMSLDILPERLERMQTEQKLLTSELEALQKEIIHAPECYQKQIDKINLSLAKLEANYQSLYEQYQTEFVLAQQILNARKAGKPSEDVLKLTQKLYQIQGKQPLVLLNVDARSIASVIADWTNIPLSSVLKEDQQKLLTLEQGLAKRIKGQSTALKALAERIYTAKSGLSSENGPLGVFLLVGPSGVGKTETAYTLADQLFGGESALITINLSEYQEPHTVSQLKGAPPGYIGYGQGGKLTEAVRKQPHALILLDEVEKAHRDVLNLFYSVFDRGVMHDGEGLEVDFRQTVIIMTSNIGSDELMLLFSQQPDATSTQQHELLHPILREHFQPALLARFQTLIYTPLDADAIREIVELKLASLKDRLVQYYNLDLKVTESFYDALVGSCLLPDTGARNIDGLLNQQLLPAVATRLLGDAELFALPQQKIIFDYSEEQGMVIDFL